MAYLNGNMNIMRFVTRENEAPRYKGTFPLKVDSVGGAVSEWYMYGNKQGVGEKQIVEGNVPLDFVSDGTDLENYRLFGTAEGAGETENLFNKNANDTNNGYVSDCYLAVDNRELANEYYVISEYIQIQPSTTYYLSNVIGSGSSTALCFYNANKEYISGVKLYVSGTRTTEVISPDDAVFLRTSIQVYNGYIDIAMITKKEVSEYIPFGYKIPLKVTNGTETKDTAIPIGDTKLMAGDYIDYKSGKIYKAKRIHEDTVTIDGIKWDILDYDHDEVYKADGTRAKHTVTIQTHDIIDNLQYSARQAAFAFPDGLAAGAYKFTVGAHPWVAGDINKVLTFTLANDIAAGGQLVFNGAHNSTLVGTTISAFASPTSTTELETVTMTEGDTGTDLGTMLRSKTDTVNSIDRAMRGSNNWLESAMRQYLNSDKAAGSVWSPQTVFDRPPAWASTTAGFLHGIDPDFVAVLGNVKKTTGLNNISDGGGTAVHDEKFFLLSRSEIYMGDEYTGGEGTPYAYYEKYSDNRRPSTNVDNNRIKYLEGTVHNWWLRSPYAGNANTVRLVRSSGAWSTRDAVLADGVAPACCIILDDVDDWVKQTFYTENTIDLPEIETFKGTNTLDSTETLGETTITQGYQVPLDIRNLNDTNEITKAYRADIIETAGATIDVDIQAGTVTINGTTNNAVAEVIIYMTLTEGDYWYSGVPKQEDNSIMAKLFNTHYLPPWEFNKWDGSEPGSDIGYGEEAVIDASPVRYCLSFAPNHTYNNLVIKPKLQKATIADTKNIYVGNKLLGEGEMVSRESTSLDIELERGQSVFETTLTNKPEMIVTPDSYEKIKDMLLNTEQYDYNETQTDYITDDVTEVTQ